MSIEAKKAAHVIVLVGEDACSRLPFIANYLYRALNPGAWRELLLVWAAPESGVARVAADLPQAVGERCLCAHVGEGPCSITEEIRDEIQTMGGPTVELHMVCSGFSAWGPDANAPADLLGSFNENLRFPITSYVYLIMEEGAADVQSRAAQALMTAQKQWMHVMRVFLLGRTLHHGAAVSWDTVWKAVRCHILCATAGVFHPGQLMAQCYSLGYTSLNATERDLYDIRREALTEAFEQRMREEMREAWQTLTGQLPPDGLNLDNAVQMDHCVRQWMEACYISPMDERIRKNLRALCAVDQQEDIGVIDGALRAFYAYNDQHEWAAVEQMKRFFAGRLEWLSRQVNAPMFPQKVICALRESLERVAEKAAAGGFDSAAPAKRWMETRRAYNNRCFQAMENTCRLRAEAAFVAGMAGFVKDRLDEFEQLVKEAGQTCGGAVAACRLPLAESGELKRKYPVYTQAVEAAVKKQDALFVKQNEGQRAYYPLPTGAADRGAIREAVRAENERLHRQMPQGFDGAFMDAIRTEFNTDTKMKAFFDSYLVEGGRMLVNILDAGLAASTVYFADEGLSQADWAQSVDNALFLDNDNVERMELYGLAHDFEWYVTQGECPMFACREHRELPSGKAIPFVGAEKKENGGGSRPAARQSSGEGAGEREADHGVKMFVRAGKNLLSWEWPAKETNMVVYVNGKKMICSIDVYHAKGGFDVTDDVGLGKNEVELCHIDGRPYARAVLLGKQKPVRYGFGAGQLKVERVAQAMDKLLVCERTPHGNCYYPLCLPPKADGDVACIKGLTFGGMVELVCLPNDLYPEYRPVKEL